MFQNTTIRIGKMFQNQKKKFEKVSKQGIVCVKHQENKLC